MKNQFLAFFVCFALGVVCAAPVFAKDKSEELDDMREKLETKLKEMSKDMTDQEEQHFQTSYNNYILINTVQTVQTDVGSAVTACGEKNPDMKDKMGDRFDKWNAAVNPVVSDSRANLDNMVLAQDYASKEDMQQVFDFIDKTREISRSQFERVPVTTPEACQHLLDKMDETQDNMVTLLRQTLMSFPMLHPLTEPAAAEEGATGEDVPEDSAE